jgi:hypothetical protein
MVSMAMIRPSYRRPGRLADAATTARRHAMFESWYECVLIAFEDIERL